MNDYIHEYDGKINVRKQQPLFRKPHMIFTTSMQMQPAKLGRSKKYKT